jgi:endonuclease/exonuclease/phosphatase family metal-dependent hydrolase
VRDRLENAFERAGNGFGFTLNRSPKFVRIDNQFFSDKIKIQSFTTHSEIKYSDHYPISASYQLP